jgi:hypothetical protein
MIEERKLKRPGLVRVFDPGEMDVRFIRLNAGSIGCTQRNFAAADWRFGQNSAQLGATP